MDTPVVVDFKNYFLRDFPYGGTLDTVTDDDVQRGLDEASIDFNPGLWSNQTEFTAAYLYLAAHRMVTNIATSSQGITGQYSWLQAAKNVGPLGESFQFPQRVLDNPMFAMLSKTRYGAKYLEMVMPRLVGAVFSTARRTSP